MDETEFLVYISDTRAGLQFKTQKEGDCGFDLEAWFPNGNTEIVIMPWQFVDLPTGLCVKVGDNSWGMVRARSSTLFKRRLLVGEGTIDSGYTGPLFVTVYNPTPYAATIKNGDRLAQLIPVPKFKNVKVTYVSKMPETLRGTSGFGSTGGL